MALHHNKFWTAAIWTGLAGVLAAQTPAQAPAQAAGGAAQQQPTFRVQVELVSTDVTVKDARGLFVDDLKQDEFEVYEDGIKQKIVSMTMSHGGRISNVLAPPPPPPREGVILPAARKVNDTSGRIFVFFVDDLNLQFRNSPKVRQIFQKMSKEVLHDGDLFSMVSSGTSTISVGLTYDKKRLDQAITKITGDGLTPQELIERSISGSEGPTELRYRAHVAHETVRGVLDQLEQIHDRRKILIWVSEGYDYNPYQASRYGLLGPDSGFTQAIGNMLDNMRARDSANGGTSTDDGAEKNPPIGQPLSPSGLNAQLMQQETFSDADLFADIAEVTRVANRANTTIYTIDPRGLVGAIDIDQNVNPREWSEYVRKSQDTIKILAEETGGVALVNSNDFDKGLKRIDNESSDYYILGYYSSNPDRTRLRRKIEVKILRKGVTWVARDEYLIKTTQISDQQRP
ncbi:MAG TPA: VWA domain-containing protein [Vicinamibacterales bacterium]|jgi:VWFA-related protein|nr:VWA domain-containing protein [Vicinamibacterales bacterium]